MAIEAATHTQSLPDTASGPLIHPRWVRITHWINALAMFMMIGSGWQIYDASPLFDFLEFPPQLALGGWLAGLLYDHFGYYAPAFATGIGANILNVLIVGTLVFRQRAKLAIT